MFSTLSRGSSRVRQTYICSSCRCNILAHANPQQAHLPLNGATAAVTSSFSTSARQLQAVNGEPNDSKSSTSEPATGDDSKPTQEAGRGERKIPGRTQMPLSKSMKTLRALRQSLLSEPIPILSQGKQSAKEKVSLSKKGSKSTTQKDTQPPGGTEVSTTSETAENKPVPAAQSEVAIEAEPSHAGVPPAGQKLNERKSRRARQRVIKEQKKKLLSTQAKGLSAPDASQIAEVVSLAEKLPSDPQPKKLSKKGPSKPLKSKKPVPTKSLLRKVVSGAKSDSETTSAGHSRAWTVIGEDGRTFIVKLKDPTKLQPAGNTPPLSMGVLDTAERAEMRKEHSKNVAFLADNPTIHAKLGDITPSSNVILLDRLKRLMKSDQLSESERLQALRRVVEIRMRTGRATVGPDVVRRLGSKTNVDDKASPERPSGKRLDADKKISKPLTARPGTTAHEIKTVSAHSLQLVPLDTGPLQVPKLSYGLERVLFNPGVYQLQDPRSRVFNFDPYLQTIMPVSEFDFNALKQYVTSSRDKVLISKAIAEKKKYTGSTSSTTSALAHFHFLLSQWRDITVSNLSKMFPAEFKSFTAIQRAPVSIFLRWRDGAYAIDADKQYDTANILMSLGKSMEKLLTLPTEDFEKYRKSNSGQITEEERNASEEFHYTGMGDFLLRSQLDAHDSRLPGTGMFDLKTRAVISVRMDADAYEEGRGYEIRGQYGEWESFEREYYDMIRSAFLKYSLQVRMGRMDGIFVAYHNTERIFGFQYISLPEMDFALHGTTDTTLGDQEFKLSLDLLNRVLDRATAKYPEQSIRLLIETRPAETPFTYIFAEPFTEDAIEAVQKTNKAKIEKFEEAVLGVVSKEYSEEDQEKEWARIRAKVEESVGDDEAGRAGLAGNDGSSDLDSDLANGKESEDLAENEDESDSDDLSDEEPDLADIVSAASLAEGQISEERDGIVTEDFEKDAEELDMEESTLEESEDAETTSAEDSLAESDHEEPTESDESVETDSKNVEDASEAEKSEDSSKASDTDNNGSATDEVNPANEPPSGSKGPRDIMAMTLTIRNKVNGEYVIRPKNLKDTDKWNVEYNLSEIKDPERVVKLYNMAKTRREQTSNRTVDLTKDSFNNIFLERIKRMNKKGREWRAQQSEKDKAQPTKVLDVKDEKKNAEPAKGAWTFEQGKGDGES